MKSPFPDDPGLPLWVRWFMAHPFGYCALVVAAFFLLLAISLVL